MNTLKLHHLTRKQ